MRDFQVARHDFLCRDAPHLRAALAEELQRYDEVEKALSFSSSGFSPSAPAPAAGDLPAFDGFRKVERLGAGGMGEVYKLEDLRLGRTVAA